MIHKLAALVCALVLPSLYMTATGQIENFHTGPLIEDYGPVATVEGREPIPEGTVFKVSFDIVDRAESGAINPKLVSAARFLNMHTEAGVPPENMSLALVIHGSAVHDMTNADFYGQSNELENENAALIAELIKHGVEIYICGQSAAFNGIAKSDLLPDVRLSLSAMTSHALLQQDGYTLNPF
ncbi:MAG: DsrE family protein [Hyphomonadaceae bacterium]